MSTRTRFTRDLDRLIGEGRMLYNAIQHDYHREEFEQQVEETFGSDKKKEYLAKLPNFRSTYQTWYSESLSVIKQVLPDRLQDFVSYYEYPRVRKRITFQNYMIRDCLQGLQIGSRVDGVDGSAAIPEFSQQISIIEAARATLESSLMDLTAILQADLFDSEIESARALATNGFLRAAGAVCGVVIEKHLKQVCINHSVRIRKKNPAISDFNQALKGNNSISIPQWRQIQHLADLRNLCDHDKGSEPQVADIDDLLSGTSRVLKTIH